MSEFFSDFPRDEFEGEPDSEIMDRLPWVKKEPKEIVKGPFLFAMETGEEVMVYGGLDDENNPVKIKVR